MDGYYIGDESKKEHIVEWIVMILGTGCWLNVYGGVSFLQFAFDMLLLLMADIYKFLEPYCRNSFIEGILICILLFIGTVILNSQFINSNRCSNRNIYLDIMITFVGWKISFINKMMWPNITSLIFVLLLKK